MKKTTVVALFALSGAAIALMVLKALPGYYNWLDAKLAIAIGVGIGACAAYLLDFVVTRLQKRKRADE